MTPGTASWSFEPDLLQQVSAILDRHLEETRAKGVFLIERSGQLLEAAGSTSEIDPSSFSSLAAADFAAGDQLAALLGEEEFTTLYHQGAPNSMILDAVAGHAILATLYDARTTLGLVKLKAKASVPELVTIFEEAMSRARTRPRGELSEPGWAEDAAREIDRLFSD